MKEDERRAVGGSLRDAHDFGFCGVAKEIRTFTPNRAKIEIIYYEYSALQPACGKTVRVGTMQGAVSAKHRVKCAKLRFLCKACWQSPVKRKRRAQSANVVPTTPQSRCVHEAPAGGCLPRERGEVERLAKENGRRLNTKMQVGIASDGAWYHMGSIPLMVAAIRQRIEHAYFGTSLGILINYVLNIPAGSLSNCNPIPASADSLDDLTFAPDRTTL